METKIFDKFLVKQDSSLDTGKNYSHNFQGMKYESENCMFYVWHKKEIKLVESKNLGSTMTVFYVKENKSENIKDEDILLGITSSCQIFSAFDEDTGNYYYFLPYFQTKNIEEKNQIFDKLGFNIQLENSSKGVIVNGDEIKNKSDLDFGNMGQILGLIFGLTILYGKIEKKGDKISAIKIQLPLFGQYLSFGENLQQIQKFLQENGIFTQIFENIQGDKHIYEITCNDYELLDKFSNFYNCVEKFSQITKREQMQESLESLKSFLSSEGETKVIESLENSCVKILQKI